jgi:hypothetical protein
MEIAQPWLSVGRAPKRHEYGGGVCKYRIRALSEEDLPELAAFHDLIHANLPHPHVLRRDSPSYLGRNLHEAGRTFGAFGEDDGALIAYAALAFPKADSSNLCFDLPSLAIVPDDVAVYDGSAVHPAVRGRGLQDRLNTLRRDHAVRIGAGHLLGTVSLLNPYSLRNHLDQGFVVRAIREKYGGMLRLIIHHDLNSAFVPDNLAERDCELGDPIQHRAALASGYVGFRAQAQSNKWFLTYAPARQQ